MGGKREHEMVKEKELKRDGEREREMDGDRWRERKAE